MTAAAKLVAQLREALAVEAENAPWESMATEYVRLCQAAIQRLESCIAMIEKGSEYQALQLAESEPALLETIRTLVFPEAGEWAKFCAANHMVHPPQFDPQAVSALERLYAQGISQNHPLYTEYRAAVTSRDDAKAVQVIRSIVRLNPQDTNAAGELARLENKLFQVKLKELRVALTQSDEAATLSALGELERLATPARLAETAEYGRAVAVRRSVERAEAIARADRLVESLSEERQAGAWRMVGDLLARLRALQAEHGFQLPPAAAARVGEMQQYYDAQRAARDAQAKFERALQGAGDLADSVDLRLAGGVVAGPLAETLHGQLHVAWQQVERFQRPVPEALTQKVQKSLDALLRVIASARRGRGIKRAVTTLVVLAVLAVAGWFGFQALRAHQFATELAALQSNGQVEPAEKLAAEIRRAHPALAQQPSVSARLAEIERWTGEERSKAADLESQLVALEALAATGLGQSDPLDLARQLKGTGDAYETVAPSLRAEPGKRLDRLRSQIDTHLTAIHEQIIGQTEKDLMELEALAGRKLNYEASRETIAFALDEIEPMVKALEGRVEPAVAALKLPEAQAKRVGDLRQRLTLFQKEADLLARTREALPQAKALETYLQALSGFKGSRLTADPEVLAAAKLPSVFPKPDLLLGGLLITGDAKAWAAARADTGGYALVPDSVDQLELDRLVLLRDDPNLFNILEATLIEFPKKTVRRPVYARASFAERKTSTGDGAETTFWSGQIYDSQDGGDVPVFRDRKSDPLRLVVSAQGARAGFEVSAPKPSGASECLARLELNRMTDLKGKKFERSLLRGFTDLVADKSAPPLCKAFLMQQLGAMLKLRPYSWGLEYCAELEKDLAELDQLCEGPLRSGDWMLERKRTQFDGKLAKFFGGLQGRNYLLSARLHRDVIQRVLRAGLQFGGYVDARGAAHVRPEAQSAHTFWVLREDGQALARYIAPKDAPAGGKSAVLGLSPLFYIPLDPTALLAELRPAGAAAKVPAPAIPWLENQERP